MPAAAEYLAIDLGASSGRAIAGRFDGHRLHLHELHRFENHALDLPTGIHWNAPRLFEDVCHSIHLASQRPDKPRSIAIDTWGVDYALLSSTGELLGLPHHYRDSRTRGLVARLLETIPAQRIYEQTGVQFMPLNTLFQLIADRDTNDGRLDAAASLLFMPDLLNYWLTGVRQTEHTIASTSQLFDTQKRCWASDLLSQLRLPQRLLPHPAAPATFVGDVRAPLLPPGAPPLRVVAPGSHDTASAVAGTPLKHDGLGRAYISSGTWSLVGRELPLPLRSPEALAANFTNECGLCGTTRFHKNVTGLWLLQQCQSQWRSSSQPADLPDLLALARQSPPLRSCIDPDSPVFSEFGDTAHRIRSFCASTGQPAPDSTGAIVRCILESIALKCALVIDQLEQLTGPIAEIHLVGGGSQNPLLCQFTADACRRSVIAGPAEATAVGNLLAQAMAFGELRGLENLREVIRHSFTLEIYEPAPPVKWLEALHRLKSIVDSPSPPIAE